jgi:Chaperone of endosialidase
MKTLPLKTKSINRPSVRRGLFFIPLVLGWLALSSAALAVSPAPDGGYPNGNTAEGADALFNLTSGFGNTANGYEALFSDRTGSDNTAVGFDALNINTTGDHNVANGFFALASNTTGSDNTAVGVNALQNNMTGKSNIAIGVDAGSNLTTGSNNIDIGNPGVAGEESNKIRIGTVGTHNRTFIAGIHGVTVASGVGVVVSPNGHLGTLTSSARFKEAIKPMDKASEAILGLLPVTFRYKHELDPDGIPQFGLVAEQVEKVNPNLVLRDAEGKVYSVRYEAVKRCCSMNF